jgi:hypothetical protein
MQKKRGGETIYIGFRFLVISIIMFTFFTIFLFSSTMIIDAGDLSVTPATLQIDMPEGYKKDAIDVAVTVINTLSYSVEVKTNIRNPPDFERTEGYSYIPDLSWVKTVPDVFTVPAKGNASFKVVIDIPENEKPLHYNESWEVWIEVSRAQAGFFNVIPAVRVLINTPPKPLPITERLPQILMIVIPLTLIILVVMLSKAIFARKKRTITSLREKPAKYTFSSTPSRRGVSDFTDDIDRKVDYLLSKHNLRE